MSIYCEMLPSHVLSDNYSAMPHQTDEVFMEFAPTREHESSGIKLNEET